jgi:membrane protease YdiL (CAAX protease family)
MAEKSIRPMGLAESVFFFGIPTFFLYLSTHICIPILRYWSDWPVAACWFTCGGLLVFFPLFISAFIFYRLEDNPWSFSVLLMRFRLGHFSLRILLLSLAGTLIVGFLTFLMMKTGKSFFVNFSAQPSFLSMQPLQPQEKWILWAWLPMFFFNIWGEGLFWRGYVFPRQQIKFGNLTWLVHGTFWFFFHLPFGWNLMFTLIPIIYLTSYLVQITRNTWPDIIIHTLINGSGFLLIAFGMVS